MKVCKGFNIVYDTSKCLLNSSFYCTVSTEKTFIITNKLKQNKTKKLDVQLSALACLCVPSSMSVLFGWKGEGEPFTQIRYCLCLIHMAPFLSIPCSHSQGNSCLFSEVKHYAFS